VTDGFMTGHGGLRVRSNIALAHDYLLVMRGAERTFAAMSDRWPDAPIYTLLYDEAGTAGRFGRRSIRTSPLQRLGVGQSGFRRLLPLMPSAAERLDLRDYDLVISSSSAFAHGVRTAEDAMHVSYCYTPFRYAWYEEERALAETPALLRPLLAHQLGRIRAWDTKVSARVDHYIAISELSRERIARYLERDASIVHPPVELERFSIGEPEDYLLVVCELVRHKRVDTALAAAKRAGLRVKVVGDGPDARRLRELFTDGVEFLGRASDADLARLYRGALALVMPNVEEFGITAVEAQASGRPVVAIDAGGARETVVDGETGLLVPDGDLDALADALRAVGEVRFDPHVARAQAERFSVEAFQENLADAVADLTRTRFHRTARSAAYAMA
jgi:glycosyltransferase involved in cell wall biosynthesis